MEQAQKLTTYILGGLVGYVLGKIIIPFDIPYLVHHEETTLILIITTGIGILGAIAYQGIRSSQLLKKENKVRDETIALITHEMRTGLTSTSWAVELILNNYRAVIREDDVKMLQDVLNSIHNTIMHSTNMLDVSLLDIGRLSIALKWTKLGDLRDIFKETIDRYVLGAQRLHIELSSHIDLDPEREAEVDSTRIRIILENLLENALQYVIGDVKKIEVIITNDSDYLNIQVGDTGIGIPPVEQEKIFGKFYRATNARKYLVTGSGIGLYMLREYVKAHHGKLRFESEVGKGTTFYISIPLKSIVNAKDALKTF